MEKITEITPAQQAQFPAYVEKWTKFGMNTSPMSFEKAKEIVLEVYQLVRDRGELEGPPPNPPPHRIWRCASPNLANQAGKALAGSGEGFWNVQSFGSSVARFQVVADVLGARARFSDLEIRALDLLEPLASEMGGVFFGRDFAIIVDRPSLMKLVPRGNSNVLHCPDGPAIAWGRGPDGEYSPDDPQGYAMFYWQGTEVPREWIMEKPQTDAARRARAAEILRSTNSEVLRSGAEIMGWVDILDALGKRVIDEDPNPMFGTLVEVDLPLPENFEEADRQDHLAKLGKPVKPDQRVHRSTPSRFVIARCGTGRTIAFPAMPEARTAVEAGAMSYGVDVETYRKIKTRA